MARPSQAPRGATAAFVHSCYRTPSSSPTVYHLLCLRRPKKVGDGDHEGGQGPSSCNLVGHRDSISVPPTSLSFLVINFHVPALERDLTLYSEAEPSIPGTPFHLRLCLFALLGHQEKLGEAPQFWSGSTTGCDQVGVDIWEAACPVHFFFFQY